MFLLIEPTSVSATLFRQINSFVRCKLLGKLHKGMNIIDRIALNLVCFTCYLLELQNPIKKIDQTKCIVKTLVNIFGITRYPYFTTAVLSESETPNTINSGYKHNKAIREINV